MSASRLLDLEEFELIDVARIDLSRIVTTWEAIVGRKAGAFFDSVIGAVKPKNWVGSLSTAGLTIQVSPRGAKSLSAEERVRLDRNISDMLHAVIDYKPIQPISSEASLAGSSYERVIDAFCEAVLRARRERVMRAYRTHCAQSYAVRGRLVFPAQAMTPVTRSGRFAVQWAELDEDIAANRFLKAVLIVCCQHAIGDLRQRVAAVISEFDGVEQAVDVLAELHDIHLERLSPAYVDAIELGRSILAGEAGGIFAGSLFGSGEVLLMPPLFEAFVGRLLDASAASNDMIAMAGRRGRFLACWQQGPWAGENTVELLPDAELIDPVSGLTSLIVDAKWKWLRLNAQGLGVSADDVRQMYVYAKALGCRDALLVYPWLGREEPFAMERPLMRIGAPGDYVHIHLLCIPLLWDSLPDAVVDFSAAIADLQATAAVRRDE